ncbi:MAG: ATP-binding protein [Methylococcales bacterium]|nr:ATP-binding protein [Methylococcales bacterium]
MTPVITITTFRKDLEPASERLEKMQSVGDVLKNYFGEINAHVGEQKNITCDSHGERVATVIASFGKKRIYSSCSACVELEKQKELDKEARQRQAIVQKKLNAAGIPKFYAQKNFDAFDDSFNTEARNAKKSFQAYAQFINVDTCGFLVGYGATGTGKTHLAIAVAHSVITRYTVAYMMASDIIRAIRETWSRNSTKTENQVLYELADVDLLIIDEVGVQFGTESEQNHLFEVINKRILDLKTTIILTNLVLDSGDGRNLRTFLGERTYDRLKEVATTVRFNWGSYRGTNKFTQPQGEMR